MQRLQLKTFSLSQFLDFVKNKIIVQRAISQSKGQTNKFYSGWKPCVPFSIRKMSRTDVIKQSGASLFVVYSVCKK